MGRHAGAPLLSIRYKEVISLVLRPPSCGYGVGGQASWPWPFPLGRGRPHQGGRVSRLRLVWLQAFWPPDVSGRFSAPTHFPGPMPPRRMPWSRFWRRPVFSPPSWLPASGPALFLPPVFWLRVWAQSLCRPSRPPRAVLSQPVPGRPGARLAASLQAVLERLSFGQADPGPRRLAAPSWPRVCGADCGRA